MSSLRSVETPTATTRSHPTLESTPAATPKRFEVCHSLPAYRKAQVATRVRRPHIMSTCLGGGWGWGKGRYLCRRSPQVKRGGRWRRGGLEEGRRWAGGGKEVGWGRPGVACAFQSAQKSMSFG